jgi:hypothetical protein
MLDAEADRLCNAKRYEHVEERTDQRAGHHNPRHGAGAPQHRHAAIRRLPHFCRA